MTVKSRKRRVRLRKSQDGSLTFEPNSDEKFVESDEHGQLSVGERHVELMAQETELDPFRQFGRRRLELHVRATTDGTLVQQRLLISVDLAWSVGVGK